MLAFLGEVPLAVDQALDPPIGHLRRPPVGERQPGRAPGGGGEYAIRNSFASAEKRGSAVHTWKHYGQKKRAVHTWKHYGQKKRAPLDGGRTLIS
jgi:hypothetical protein